MDIDCAAGWINMFYKLYDHIQDWLVAEFSIRTHFRRQGNLGTPSIVEFGWASFVGLDHPQIKWGWALLA